MSSLLSAVSSDRSGLSERSAGSQLQEESREFENAELLCGISPAGWKVWSG